MSSKVTPGVARFRTLVSRALFELRMAADVARAEGMEPGLTASVESSRRSLRACLARLKSEPKADEVKAT